MKHKTEVTLEKTIEEVFIEQDSLFSEGDYFSALADIGEIVNSLQHLSNGRQREWEKKLRSIQIGEDVVEVAIKEIHACINYSLRVISVRSSLIFEELVLLLTNRIDIDNVIAGLGFTASCNLEIDLSVFDEKLLMLSKRKGVSREFFAAVKSIKKHSRLPVNNRWIDY